MGHSHGKEARGPASRLGHYPPMAQLSDDRRVPPAAAAPEASKRGIPAPEHAAARAKENSGPPMAHLGADIPEGDPKTADGYQSSHVYIYLLHGLAALPDVPLLDKETTSIRAGYNRINTVPNMSKHTKLYDLGLNYNRITSIGALPASLVQLDLGNNSTLMSFPISICMCINLKELTLTHTGLGSLPDDIRNLALLEELRVDHNYLTAIPSAIGDLGALKWLYLQNNQLSALPGSILQLHSLETFEVHSNRGWLGRTLGNTPNAVLKRLNEMDLLTGVEYVADLKAMINNTAFSDVHIITEDGNIDAHRFMLSRCPAFREFISQRAFVAPSDTPDGFTAQPLIAPSATSTPLQLDLHEDFECLSMLVEYLYTHRVPRAVFSSPATTEQFAVLCARYKLDDLAAWLRMSEHVVEEDDPLFCTDLRTMLNASDSDTDLEIRLADGQSVRCHRVMLAARSDYYMCLFQSGLAESKLRTLTAPAQIASEVVRVMLAWLYSNDMELLTGENAVELLVVSDRLRIETLRSAAQSFLLAGLELDNAPYMWALARTHRAKHLEHASNELMKASSMHEVKKASTWSMLMQEEIVLLTDVWDTK